jgi:hypothetical protein
MKNEFKKFVAASHLSNEDKEMWADLLDNVSDEMLDLFVEEIGGDLEELVKFTEEVNQQKVNIGNDDAEAILAELEK